MLLQSAISLPLLYLKKNFVLGRSGFVEEKLPEPQRDRVQYDAV